MASPEEIKALQKAVNKAKRIATEHASEKQHQHGNDQAKTRDVTADKHFGLPFKWQ